MAPRAQPRVRVGVRHSAGALLLRRSRLGAEVATASPCVGTTMMAWARGRSVAARRLRRRSAARLGGGAVGEEGSVDGEWRRSGGLEEEEERRRTGRKKKMAAAAGRSVCGGVGGVLVARQLGQPGVMDGGDSQGPRFLPTRRASSGGAERGEARGLALRVREFAAGKRRRRGSGSRRARPRVPEGACGARAGRVRACPSERRWLGAAEASGGQGAALGLARAPACGWAMAGWCGGDVGRLRRSGELGQGRAGWRNRLGRGQKGGEAGWACWRLGLFGFPIFPFPFSNSLSIYSSIIFTSKSS